MNRTTLTDIVIGIATGDEMPTLILTPRFTADAQALWRAAGQLGWGVERLPNWRVPQSLRDVDEPVLYLEGLMAPTLAEQFGQVLREPPDDWLPRLPLEYRRRSVTLSTLGAARSLRSPHFIKPPNCKSFTARVYSTGAELPTDFPDETPVLVSDVVTWEVEFRCFILERRLTTFSIYLRHGELQREYGYVHFEAEATAVHCYMNRLLADERVDLPKATVVDVGVIAGRGWAVVEQNAAWGSGLYGCDSAVVLELLRAAYVPLGEDRVV